MKLSKLIKKLNTYQENLRHDPEVSIAAMPDIRIKLLKDFSLELRGANSEQNIAVANETVITVIEKQGDRFHKHIDTHGIWDEDRLRITVPVSGRYDIFLDYITPAFLGSNLRLEIGLSKNGITFTRMEHDISSGFMFGNTISNSIPKDEFKIFKKGDVVSIDIRGTAKVNWKLSVRRICG